MAIVPDATAITVVYGSDLAMKETGLNVVDQARSAGLRVDGVFEVDLFTDDYLAVVDDVLGEAQRGIL